MFKALTLLFLVAIASFVAAHEAYFKFKYYSLPDDFVFKVTDSAKIQHARNILSGAETENVRVMGRIKKSSVPYNPGWNYHLDPNTITFFNHAIEVCDATIRYVDDHLEEACGAFLPGCFWCPWGSQLIGEVDPKSASAALLYQKYIYFKE